MPNASNHALVGGDGHARGPREGHYLAEILAGLDRLREQLLAGRDGGPASSCWDEDEDYLYLTVQAAGDGEFGKSIDIYINRTIAAIRVER